MAPQTSAKAADKSPAKQAEPVVVVKQITKDFKLPHQQIGSIKGAFLNMLSLGNRSYEIQKAVRTLSFTVNKGDFFGIVGRNGSGKSTLLKMLAGIYQPTKGTIRVEGRLVPFIELGVGFNPELTGRENVYLNGALLGFSQKEIDERYDKIVSFAELEKFMDQKLKNYSSGMQVRLAFSIAIQAESDILLIDEVLAVGDTSFQKKCYEIFTALKKSGKTIIFVTHDMSAVERFCNRVLVIDKGMPKGIFSPGDASEIYDELNADKAKADEAAEQEGDATVSGRWGSGEVKLDSLAFYSEGKKLPGGIAEMGKPLEIHMKLSAAQPNNVVIGLAIEDVFGVNISGPNSLGVKIHSDQTVVYTIDKLSLLPGEYAVTTAIYDEALIREYDHRNKAFTLKVKSKSHNLYGKVNLFGNWEAK
jgi:ABC-2 type transport system ATP-binding protein